jgi:parvulin-like peptidyl-prolyl isomerase
MKKLTLICAALALCAPALEAAATRPDKAVIATVNGKNITAGDLSAKLWWQHASTGLNELVDEVLILAEAERLKIKADPKEVQERVDSLKNADKVNFERNLKAVGWTEADLKNLITRQITMRETVIAARKIAVNDDNLKAFFETNKDKLATPEAVKLSQIFVNTQADAESALDSLMAGADFNKLSALKSSDENLKKNAGSLGFVSRGALVPEIEREVFNLELKKPSGVIATGNGFSIFMAEERRASQPAVYDSIKDELRVAILNQALSQQLPQLAAELRQSADIKVIPPGAK